MSGGLGVSASEAKGERYLLQALRSPGEAAEDPAGGKNEAGVDLASVGPAVAPGGATTFCHYPRTAHFAIQCIANVACDEQVDPASEIRGFAEGDQGIFTRDGASGGVTRIVLAGGVPLLRSMMLAHLQQPRLLEDAVCALSNIAYCTDAIRLKVGQSCSSVVVSVMEVFGTDAYLFNMALRAVGNLTRCDENIVSVMAYGAAQSIGRGMEQHPRDLEVLSVAADVIGNLASIEDESVEPRKAARILEKGVQARERALEQIRQAAGNSSNGSGSGSGSGAPGSSPQEVLEALLGQGATSESLQQGLVSGEVRLQEIVCNWIVSDGAAAQLVAALRLHSDKPKVVKSCLRSIQYLTEVPSVARRLCLESGAVEAVVLVLRACDFDPRVADRGSYILGQFLRLADSDEAGGGAPSGTRSPRQVAFEAGAGPVLLSLLETHMTDRQVCRTLVRTLAIAGLGSGGKIGASVTRLAEERATLTNHERRLREALRLEERGAEVPGALDLNKTGLKWSEAEDGPLPGIGTYLTDLPTDPSEGQLIEAAKQQGGVRALIRVIRSFMVGAPDVVRPLST